MAKGKRETANEISAEKVAVIRADIAVWEAGLWAKQVAPGPACRCGRRRQVWTAEGGGTDDGVCYRHPAKEGTEDDPQEHGSQPGTAA